MIGLAGFVWEAGRFRDIPHDGFDLESVMSKDIDLDEMGIRTLRDMYILGDE